LEKTGKVRAKDTELNSNYAAFHWDRELVFTRGRNWWSLSWVSQILEINWREMTETK